MTDETMEITAKMLGVDEATFAAMSDEEKAEMHAKMEVAETCEASPAEEG